MTSLPLYLHLSRVLDPLPPVFCLSTPQTMWFYLVPPFSAFFSRFYHFLSFSARVPSSVGGDRSPSPLPDTLGVATAALVRLLLFLLLRSFVIFPLLSLSRLPQDSAKEPPCRWAGGSSPRTLNSRLPLLLPRLASPLRTYLIFCMLYTCTWEHTLHIKGLCRCFVESSWVLFPLRRFRYRQRPMAMHLASLVIVKLKRQTAPPPCPNLSSSMEKSESSNRPSLQTQPSPLAPVTPERDPVGVETRAARCNPVYICVKERMRSVYICMYGMALYRAVCMCCIYMFFRIVVVVGINGAATVREVT